MKTNRFNNLAYYKISPSLSLTLSNKSQSNDRNIWLKYRYKKQRELQKWNLFKWNIVCFF